MAKTIGETIDSLHESLRDYIESTYHIGNALLIGQRRKLLDRQGVTRQVPYLESTPRYQTGANFADIPGIPPAALEAFSTIAKADGKLDRILYDPPYKHQSQSISYSLVEGRNVVIMTGTGSGKTESFLLPILGKLAREAKEKPASFKQPAMRALLLYPMNALVNDQLGRLRSLFGDPRLVKLFKGWAGRPPRFSRYTSRTPYAGVRTSKKDQNKLKSFGDFYVEIERAALFGTPDEQAKAGPLLAQLKARGKWPAKPNLAQWFGAKGDHWINKKTKEFLRANTLPDDTELVTRQEVQVSPPDLMVTNYSMLEYMLMRPIERSIFDETRDWLQANSTEKFMVVLDEAHLYRGAAGAEVGLLLRRLRDRLRIPIERFQVICATASFNDEKYAPDFGAQLSGAPASTFRTITGALDYRPHAASGSSLDGNVLADIKLDDFYSEVTAVRNSSIAKFLAHRALAQTGDAEKDLFEALKDFSPLGLLVNTTMKKATQVASLAGLLFPDNGSNSNRAVTSLLALGSVARKNPTEPGLLPCRVHNFFRGLPGLWVCMDSDCSELAEAERSGHCGKMFSQPHDRCGCGASVLEFYTCRSCGTAHARGYAEDIDNPSALWSEPGRRLHMLAGDTIPLLPLDLLLEEPLDYSSVEPADYDLDTGRLNTPVEGRKRTVYIRKDRITPAVDDEGNVDTNADVRGLLVPCAVCGERARGGRTTVQDHQTKGDQPFQAIVSRQIQVQPPGPMPASRFAPLRGRKVLVFSDSRQVAARLAPNLQMYSLRDSLRSLILRGMLALKNDPMLGKSSSLEDLYFAVLIGAKELGVRLRPELKPGENFAEEDIVEAAVAGGALADPAKLLDLWMDIHANKPPLGLLDDLIKTVQDRYIGFEALALGSIAERPSKVAQLATLVDIPGVAETSEQKLELVRAWLRCWRANGFWLNSMPNDWYKRPRSRGGTSIRSQKGQFAAMQRVLLTKPARKIFDEKWTPILKSAFTTEMDSGFHRLAGQNLTLKLDGAWVRCNRCKSIHRPVSTLFHCLDCTSTEVVSLDPETDAVFKARKGYYRNPVMAALGGNPLAPMALIAGEHTAQLNAPQSEDVFSRAEENELLFQDVELTFGPGAGRATALDVLSSTTTMEVGIDIGALSGVALRNMPPGRANYQQRAGRAGRRGNAVATVVAFGSADSHDEHYFSEPDAMISGPVVDPKLTLDNPEIVKRHMRAFLLQAYHQDKLPAFDPTQTSDLFSVLGDVEDFRSDDAVLNRKDFEYWLNKNETPLKNRADDWIPEEIDGANRRSLLDGMIGDCLNAVDKALGSPPIKEDQAAEAAFESDDDDDDVDIIPEVGDDLPDGQNKHRKLLDRLLYEGILPRYAFPTDVAAFNVFDLERSSRFRPIMKFAPSQSLPVALSQYAPGKQVWIAGKCYTSSALYSVGTERYQAWESRRLYRECSECGFAETLEMSSGLGKGVVSDCYACGSPSSFGPTQFWLRPPGFAHPWDSEEVTSPDDMPETAYATRAKLTMPTPPDEAKWISINDRTRVMSDRKHLLVSNTGPDKEGYNYCTLCGRIEATSGAGAMLQTGHTKPYIDEKEQSCPGNRRASSLVLGTDFITDIALFSLRVAAPLKLKPAYSPTEVALRTVAEALAKAACQLLEIEPGELMAEYRPALTPAGTNGLEAEIFLYDTLPGGAGFAAQLMNRGAELLERALRIVKTCPEDCDASCYRCLRSFKNKFEHASLDRHVGAELLEYLLSGDIPQFNEKRIGNSTRLLCQDLERQNTDGTVYIIDEPIQVPGMGNVDIPILVQKPSGKRFAIALSGALTNDFPADPKVTAMRENWDGIEVLVVNELLVRGNLPAATQDVISRTGI